jgi:cell volume regulation protein A
MVFSCLGLFSFFGKNRFTVHELLFISFVRETGAIPAVLLVIISTKGLLHIEPIVPIGMWVIISTLLFQPLLTRWVSWKLRLVE